MLTLYTICQDIPTTLFLENFFAFLCCVKSFVFHMLVDILPPLESFVFQMLVDIFTTSESEVQTLMLSTI